MALFALGGAYLLAERERNAFQRGASERVRALMTAVDAEIRGSITTLEAVAALEVFDGEHPERFRPEAARIMRTQPYWRNIVVSRPGGEPVFNLLAGPGRAPASPDPESIARVAREKRSIVTHVTGGPIITSSVIAIRAPAVRDGETRYVVTAVIDPQIMKELLQQQRFPPGWPAAIVDDAFRFIARSPEPPAGSPAVSASLREALATSNEGWQEGHLLDGQPIYRAFIRSRVSGWSTSVAIPKAVVDRSAYQAVLLLVLGVLLAIAAGGVLAALLARRIAAPIAALAAAAPRLGQGTELQVQAQAAVAEVRELARALQSAEINIREREARQKEAEAALRAADRAKDEFLAMLGHELRNPLSALSTSAELLRVGRRDAEMVDNAQQMIQRQTRHMAHLVDDLLEVSRVTRGKIRLEKEPLDISEVAANVLATWRDAGRLGRHRVSESLSPAWVDADAARMEQIVSNLLDNAIKYTPAGGAIRIAVRSEAGEALIEVADEGEGIAPELIERVFDLFVQGERSLARQQGGLGIGLTLVRRLAELHGGTVRAQSPGPGGGATFTVRFPAIAALASAAVRERPHARFAAARILIVEDNADARESLARLLTLKGHSVVTAASGAQALHAVALAAIDLALVDIGLPDMDGYQLARRLRRATEARSLWLVALTGYGKAEDREAALDAGFDEHLTKPVELESLVRLIADLRGRRRAA